MSDEIHGVKITVNEAVPNHTAFMAGKCPNCVRGVRPGGLLCPVCNASGVVGVRVDNIGVRP